MKFKHIEYQDRLKTKKLLYENKSFSQIGKAIGKNKSSQGRGRMIAGLRSSRATI